MLVRDDFLRRLNQNGLLNTVHCDVRYDVFTDEVNKWQIQITFADRFPRGQQDAFPFFGSGPLVVRIITVTTFLRTVQLDLICKLRLLAIFVALLEWHETQVLFEAR